MYETSPLKGVSTELQDLLMCESFFDDFDTTNDLNSNPNISKPPSATLSEFEAQIQAMLSANNNDLGNFSNGQNQQISSNNTIQDFKDFQYSVSTSPEHPLFSSPDMLASLSSPNMLASLSSPDSFLNSPNSFTTFDDNGSLSTVSPPHFNTLQDFIISPNDTMMQDSGHPFDRLLTSKEDLDALNLIVTQRANKRNSSFDRDSISPDKSIKKKRRSPNSGIGKSIKSSTGLKPSGSPKVTLGEQFIKNEPPSSVPNMMCNDGTAQSIVVPSSPIVPSDLSMLTFNQDTWNQTINPSATSFVPDGIMDVSSQFTSMPLLVRDRDGSSPTAKLPINRLKSTVTNTQPQQNFQPQPNKQQKKVAHNAIERRYRNNINDRINDLKNVVPALCHLKSKDSKDDDDIDEVDGIPAATKLNKATILRKATEYINYLKSNNQKLKRDNETLRKLIEALPGGVEIYNAYMAEQPDERDEPPVNGHHTPPTSSPGDSPPDSPNYPNYDAPPTPPVGNTGSRALMALFMCMTFFTSPSSYITQSSHPADHHHEGRVLTSSPTPVEKNSLNVNDGILTIDLWYLIRIFTFLMCLTYILRPSLFSSQTRRSRRKSNSIITSVLKAKTKDAKALYQSLSSLSNGPPVNVLEVITGLISESIKFSLRRFLRWDITSDYTHTDDEGRLLEVALWGRLGEVELCGGNDKVSRLSVLHTCLRTINLLESPYTTRKYVYLSPSRIYANAALQSYIGLSSFPFLAEKAVAHFWKLANKEKVRSGAEEKWLEIALNSDHQSETWKGIVNRISDYVFLCKKTNEENSNIELMKNITIPLALVTDIQAMIHLKQTFYKFISIIYGGKKKSSSKNKQSFSFIELVRYTTPNSFAHWYALVGCSIEAFSLGQNVLGENFVNMLKDNPTIKSDENNCDKQIIAMGLLSHALLMRGKLEASLRCANKTSIALTKRKEQRNGGGGELSNELNDDFLEIEHEVHDLTEFCVGWIVLEAKSLGWKIVEGLSSINANSSAKPSVEEEKENASSTTTTLANKLPKLFDSERLQSAIIIWTRYLRRLSKNSVFDGITEVREIFIKKLVILERIVNGELDDMEDDSSGYECECEVGDGDGDGDQHKCNVNNNNSQSLSEHENRAIKAWSLLKGM